MNDLTIEVKNVVKAYKLYNKPSDRLKESLKKNSCYHKDFYAVNDVSFSVKRGETVGIIGKNGAGKSTMLKMITGVLSPTSGSIKLSGNVSALLELGTGFDAERNGIENIYLNGRINGLTKKEIEDSIDDILEFADIGDFIYQPIKTYSSGMLVRLAFATAINVKPEILIVDEALSVGDVRFQQKCYRKIREFKENGTVLFVSHDTGAIASFCDRVIWLDDGKIYKEGAPGEILEEYLSYMRYDVKSEEQETIKENLNENEIEDEAEDEVDVCLSGFGNGAAKFTKISLCNSQRKKIAQVHRNQEIIVNMEILTTRRVESPILGFNIKDTLGNELVVSNNIFEKVKLPILEKGKKYCFEWKFRFPSFHAGDYLMDIALAEGTYQNHEQIQFISDALLIKCSDSELYQEGRGRYLIDDVELYQV